MKGNENIKHPIGIDPQEITGAAAPGRRAAAGCGTARARSAGPDRRQLGS